MLTSIQQMLGLANTQLTPYSTDPQSEQTIARWLCLQNVPQMGFVRLSASAEKLGCSIFDLPFVEKSALEGIGWSNEQVQAIDVSSKAVQKHYKLTCNWLNEKASHSFIGLNEPAYPALLQSIARPPLFLYVDGNTKLLNKPKLAFVGTRKPSLYATQTTYDLVKELAQASSAITISGLALGIDAACHKASILHKVPTIGVLGCGVNVVYPKRHQQLYKEVAESGALVSEFLLNTQPSPNMFPRRNRIITGLSLGTVIVEAKIKSGSLVSAKYALEQNREVFAVPNNINNPYAEGCHWLIKQGAKLTENIWDVIEELPSIALLEKEVGNAEKNKKNAVQGFTSDPLLDSVSYSATSVDLIAKRSGMSLSDVLALLLEYEMRGLVASTAEGYVKLRA